MLEFEDVPLGEIGTVCHGFGPEPTLELISGIVLRPSEASRHGSDSMQSPPPEPPSHEEWKDWEHDDRIGTELAAYEAGDPYVREDSDAPSD